MRRGEFSNAARKQKGGFSLRRNRKNSYPNRDISGDRRRRRDDEIPKRSHDRDSWTSGRDYNYASRDCANDRRDALGGISGRFCDEPRQQQPVYHSGPYGSFDEECAQCIKRETVSMMSNLPSNSLFEGAGVAAGWGMNMASSTSAGMPFTANMGMSESTSAGMNPFTYMGMASDLNFGMMGMGNYGQYGTMGTDHNLISSTKEVIRLSKCVLYPPNPKAPPLATREKPLGCKTVFVGGLPNNATEEIIKEIFMRCGEILTIRMSKKNFCHIRFSSELYIDNAIYFSGYRIKIDNRDDAPNTGRLHVDYAQARDDQYEYECHQRSLQREARRREELEQSYNCPPTPPPVVRYSEQEVSILGEKLRNEETFQEAMFVLTTWLERGECNRQNSGYFYSMIQSTNSHVRRLMNERVKYEDELNKAKMMMKQQMQCMLMQFNEIGKVFNAVSVQKVWDHFTKAQRKNIELWKKQMEEIKNTYDDEVLNDRIEDEMELSEDEAELSSKKNDTDIAEQNSQFKNIDVSELDHLREENDSLKCQLEASQNEAALLRSEFEQEKSIRERQIQHLTQNLQNATSQLQELNNQCTSEQAELRELRVFKQRHGETRNGDLRECSNEQGSDSNSPSSSTNLIPISMDEAFLIGLMTTFLNIHPFGASIDYICSYLCQFNSTVCARDVETLMKKFPNIFREESSGMGPSLVKKWILCGFESH